MQHQEATTMAELVTMARKRGYKNLDGLTAQCVCGASLMVLGILHYPWCKVDPWSIEFKRSDTK